MTPDSLHDAVLARIEKRVAENYQDAEGRSPVDPHAVAVIVAPAALAAIEEQGMVIVSAEDLRAVVGETRSYETYTAALPRLRAVLSGTAPQPPESPQGAQAGDGGISGPSDNPGASAGLSAPHADDLHRRYAEAIRHALFGPHSGDAAIDGVFDRSVAPAARAVMAVRDTELETARRELAEANATLTELAPAKDRSDEDRLRTERNEWMARADKAEAGLDRDPA
ncbi:hypothetical protein [Streptosporangium roseum]|uniref:hypothetical protein n=1 Tax=Streptosporangium roseum TaxID=2001 RepID=UPI003316AD07